MRASHDRPFGSVGGGGRVNTELVAALTKALADAQRELESERARSEQLVLRLHQAGRREQQYIALVSEQNELIALLEGRDLGVRNVA